MDKPESKQTTGISLTAQLKQKTGDNKKQTNRSKLWGTGLTKKDAQRTERATEKVGKQTSKLDEIPSGRELNGIIEVELPTTLVPDDLQLDPSQQQAVDGLLNEQYGCLIGAAGTGKTTTIKYLVHRILREIKDPEIAFCSFTGRAVQQIKRALPLEYHSHCDTIHGLLEYAPESIEYDDPDTGELKTKKIFRPRRTEYNPLSQNIIIVDEGGMTPIDLWNNLMRACRPGTRVYLIGDINQLPPVQGRSVLGFAMLKWKTFELNRIHRTDEDAITNGAWNILNGKMPESVDGKIVLKRVSDSSVDCFKETIATIQKLSEIGVFNPLRDGLIVPQNVGNLGQEFINERLCPFFNPPRKRENIVLNPRTIVTAGYNHISFAVGDKIMVTENDRERGLTNGMTGVIEELIPNPDFRGEIIGDMAAASLAHDYELDLDGMDAALSDARSEEEQTESEREKQASHIMRVMFQNIDEPIEFSTAGAINSLKHAYAFTCHKSQGGEYPVVVILVHSANLKMLAREWLYTAWTRAQQKIILLYNSRGIQQSLRRQHIKGKTLEEKAKAFIKLNEKKLTLDERKKMPILPEPQTYNFTNKPKAQLHV